ncbi:hypothetical protein OIU84_023273 [Salix udensis]|uniref:Protein kinase domain-containing protein n=1 Tax=Salix udensis TaxID=889485 RepID=A0AAD6KQZ1_9ROSI|nr:hypothetical protein OIU84_023273 [Salix udensis]
MERTQPQGPINATLFSPVRLQSIVLSNNQLNGTLDLGTNYGSKLVLVDLQNNSIGEFVQGTGYKEDLLLEHGIRSFSFSDFQNGSYYIPLQAAMMEAFKSDQLPVDSISLCDPFKDADDYLELNNITFFKHPHPFGPFFFTLNDNYFTGSDKSPNTGIIIGAAVGGSVLMLLLIMSGVYAFHQRKMADRATQQMNPFASWDQNKANGAAPQIKGVLSFSFEELRKCTNNFSEVNALGAGGYGTVYKGTLLTGVLVAIKRAKQGSMQEIK